MKIARIALNNFRQFYGTVAIDFATDASTNVTVIHAANAAGKTALLNAFRWCLYGKVNLPSPDHIVSNRLIAETEQDGTLEVSVSLEFDHEGQHYLLERSHRFRKHSDLNVVATGSQVLRLSRIGEDGQSVRDANPQDRVRQILPEDIHPYFFFDGEDMTALSQAEDRVQDGIRNLMSITQLDRGVKHLASSAKLFRKEFSELATDEAKRFDHEIEECDRLLAELDSAEQESSQRHSALQSEKSLVEERLKKIEPARDLQNKREELEREELRLRSQLDENTLERHLLLRTHGPLPFLAKAAQDAHGEIEDKRSKGSLPAGIKDVFINDLLERECCLCSRDLAPGTEPRRVVETFLAEQAGSSEVENRLQTLAGQIQTLEGNVGDLNRGLAENLKRRQRYMVRRNEIGLELSEIASMLMGKDDIAEVAELEEKRTSVDDQIRKQNRTLGAIKARREDAIGLRYSLKEQLEKLSVQEKRAELAKKRYHCCEEAKGALEEMCAILVQQVRKKVSERINGVLNRVTGNDFHVELTEDFRLKTYQKVGEHSREIAKSTGQSQVTSLSFIGSLLDILREQNQRSKEAGGMGGLLRGGEYPIVMDSPFGSLDDIYGPRIAGLAPQLAPQVVVMVSGKQWLGGIAEALYPRIGRRFVLVKNKPEPSGEDLRDGTIVLGGATVTTVVKSDTYEYTTVQEVRDA